MSSTPGKRKRLPGICFHATWGLDYVRLSGRMIYLGAHGDPEVQRNYDIEIQRWLASGRKLPEGSEEKGDVYTIDHLIADYLDFLERRGRYMKNGEQTSEMDSVRSALRCLSELCGKVAVAEFGKKTIRRFEEHLIANGSVTEKGKRITLTRPGVNSKVRQVKRMILWAHEEELVPDAVAGAVKLIRPLRRGETSLVEPKRRDAVSDDHVAKALKHFAPEVAVMVQIQRRTGMRPGEVCLMRWCDIDKTPIVVSGIACWTYAPSTFKTEHWNKEVSYPLDPVSQGLLEPFARVKASEFIFSPRRAALTRRLRLRRRRKSAVQPSQQRRDARCRRNPRRFFAERYDAKSYALAIRRACKKAGIGAWTPHQLRHARISEIAHDPRLGAMAASIAANHSSLAATERYIHRDRRLAYEVAVTTFKKA